LSKRKKKRKRVLDRFREAVKQEHKHFSIDELAEMIESNEANARLFALLLMRKQIEEGDLPDDYFKLARKAVKDTDNNCRWQSLIVVSESIETRPDLVWEVISEFGDSVDSDMRVAIAVVLLEHLLDYDFNKYFSRVRKEILQERYRFIDTLSMCSFDSRSGLNYKKAQSFLRNAKRGLSKDEWTS